MILLVDNRDSYTFNLAHLIATVTGSQPEIVRQDDVQARDIPRRIKNGDYSHVVISPGPGTPECDDDFEGSRLVIEAADGVPLLGVCLGHQGLAHIAGGKIGSTSPAHGLTSRVTHTGEGIFAGLPQEFMVVRYHSLHVEDDFDGEKFRVHARSDDGIVQGLEVIGQPHWGVQFHPESVLTECGDQLLRNFFALRRQRGHNTPTVWSLAHECLDGEIDVEATARALMGTQGDAFWLDCATDDGFSIVGSTVGSLSAAISFRVDDAGDDIFTQLASELDSTSVTADNADFGGVPFRGGWVGFLGYECATLTLPDYSSRHRSSHPDAYFVRPQSFIVYDHAERRSHLMVCSDGQHGSEASDLMDALRASIQTQPVQAAAASINDGHWRLDRDGYDERFGMVKQSLADGDSYEVCLTDTYETTAEGSGIDLYARLRRFNPAPYSAYLRLGEVEVLSTSPERFLRVRDRHVEAKPIKGTLPRTSSPQMLVDDPKTRAENLMIVDLLRNDLSRVCTPGSVTVPTLMAVETYETVHQLVSTVTGHLRPDSSLVDLLRATFPGGSMTGAPKERTCSIIDALEVGPRGVYSGAIGYLGFDGTADLSVVIRTAVKHGDQLTVGAGGAIVWDSTPDAEYAELQLKANAVLKGLS